ncbi:hypothetical protein Tco_1508482 [Tanacetum coccineum]
MWRVKSFMPMDSELEDKRLKRVGSVQEQSDEEPKADELSQEQLQQLMIIVPEEGMNVEALQTKYPIIDWEVYSKDTIKFWKIIIVGNYTKNLASHLPQCCLMMTLEGFPFVIVNTKEYHSECSGKYHNDIA